MANNIKFSLLAIEAKDLFASDSNGFSDPYFKIPHRQNGVVDIPGKKNRSQTIKKNLNPVWNHNFDVEFNPQIVTKLNIEVYDYDTFGKDDLIGSATIDLNWMLSGGQDNFDGWIPLYVMIKDKKTKVAQNTQKGSVHVKLQVKYRPSNMPMGPTVQQMITNPQMNQSMPPPTNQSVPPQMSQPPAQVPNMYPTFSQNPQQAPHGQPPMGQPPMNQPPMGQQPVGQPPLAQQQNQQPMGQPPMNQPPLGQPPNGQPPYQPPVGQLPNQPPMGQPPMGQPPLAQPPNQPPMGQPPIGQPPNQPPMVQPPNQPPMIQPPMGQTTNQPPAGQPPYQPPTGQPPYQAQGNQIYGQPPLNKSMVPPQAQYPYAQPPPNNQSSNIQSKIQMFNSQIPSQPHMPYAQQPGYNSQQSSVPPHYAPPPNYNTAPHYPPQPGYSAPPHYPPQPGYVAPPHYATPPHYAPPPVVNIVAPVFQISPHVNGQPFQPGMWVEIIEPTVMVGLGWDFTGRETFDLDASVTGFDYNFNVVESVYFSNKRGMNNSVIHFGDNTTGKGEGDDELIKVGLSRIPLRVHFLAVTINSYKKNSLIRAKSAYIRLYTESFVLGKYTLNRTKDCIGLLLGVFERNPTKGTWYFRVMADPISGNKVTLSYEDIKTLLGSYSTRNMGAVERRIVHPLPGEPVIEFNKWIQLQNRFTYIGLGWHIQQGFNYDLDASILTFDRMNNLMEIIFHKNMNSYNQSIIHYGDNRSGVGEGDDEILSVDFGHVDPNVFTMVVVINSFKGNPLSGVMDAFIRLYDTTRPLGVTLLKNAPECVGLCFGIFRKHTTTGVWYFSAVKEIVQGIEAPQSVNDVVYLLGKYPLKV